jgi:hypothetical protein
LGCDIHGWVEVRPYKWDEEYWSAVYDIDHLDRNYVLFDRLFGVRGPHDNVKPLAEQKGIPPSGVHDEFNDWRAKDLAYWEADGHSHSWVSLQEIIDNEKTLLAPYAGYDENHALKWAMLFNIMKELSKVYGIDNVRLVAWFDN